MNAGRVFIKRELVVGRMLGNSNVRLLTKTSFECCNSAFECTYLLN